MIYYETTFKGTRVRLKKKDHAALLKRFDPKLIRSGRWLNSIVASCPLCARFEAGQMHCGGKCSFRDIGQYGCVDVIKSRVGKCTTRILSIGYDEVSWHAEDDKEARHRLKRIREELKKFKRVEA